MSDSPSPALLPATSLATLDRDRLGSDRGAMGRAIDETHRKLTPTPENPDTFTGLLARFDTYLAQLQKAESALEEHTNKLVTIDPADLARMPTLTGPIGDDKSNSVIKRLQARVDKLSALVSAMSRHQDRADRAF